jgi:hypothetical protein
MKRALMTIGILIAAAMLLMLTGRQPRRRRPRWTRKHRHSNFPISAGRSANLWIIGKGHGSHVSLSKVPGFG